ncbi:peptide/nickel transport system substrate-binding protein [Murinocardiopsis flavida]|uniref:Peptide/nickel transport system substrate-binding protein n=1 Tax=Murinocardiopsis flavida TaxID=645275 RepID=A0A2P8DSW7_9ACTN|nr:ABC transporter substrate-binding protein [Murinocardiopsis flavida]PSL00307.1 peptide/nickel transport system substrate-binding protein [Murinocardiopsis flavida]
MRTRWLAGGAAIAVLAASGCGAGGGPPAGPQKQPAYLAEADTGLPEGGRLDLQIHVDSGAATGLDPQGADTATSWQLMSLVYETLVTVGSDFDPEPGLAEKWEQPSPTKYVFHLRDDVEFSNGRAMTADDVVGSMERLLDGSATWKGQLGPLKSVDKVDAGTVEFTLDRPYTPFLAALANVPAAVLPMKEVADGSVDPAKDMLGTGPFVMAKHRQDVSWRFDRNEHYWADGAPALDGIDISVAPQGSTRIAGLQDGSSGMAILDNVDAPQVLKGARDVEVGTQATTDFFYLMLNTKAAGSKFADKRVRSAVNIAMDRQLMADAGTGGLGSPTAVTPAGLPGACDPAELPAAKEDLDRARKLLEDAGAEDLSFKLAIYSTEPAPAIAQVVQQNLEKIGVTVDIQQLDEGSWADEVYGASPAKFDAALSWFAGYADPAMVGQWWNPESAGFNQGFMTPDPALDKAIDTAVSEPEGKGRAAALEKLCAAVDADAQMIPLVTRPLIVGYRKDAVSPSLYGTEGYGNALRLAADFRAAK